MFFWLRKKRRELVSMKKVRKYLLYALGEIILVMIGILLAVYVNSVYEQGKNDKKRAKLLIDLKAEFESNKQQLDTTIYYLDKSIWASVRSLEIMRSQDYDFTSDSIAIITQNLEWSWTFDPINGALRSGISSGDINLIKSDSLSKFLFSWQDINTDLDENEERQVTHMLNSWDFLSRYIRKADRSKFAYYEDIQGSVFPSDYKGLYNDPLFEDFLVTKYLLITDVITELIIVRNHNLKILELIDQELSAMN